MRLSGTGAPHGGDLNSQSEKYLLDHYAEGGVEKPFAVEVAKACHHGSGDFRDDFLAGINALVTIISSGDNESYAHPRPDTLGAMGKAGRGTRPLIFSTELARSATESIKHPNELRTAISGLSTKISNEPDEARQKKLEADFKKLLDTLDRTVTVYGMINVRTDGERMVVAQRLESNRTVGKKWDIHQFKPNAAGELEYVRREEHYGRGGEQATMRRMKHARFVLLTLLLLAVPVLAGNLDGTLPTATGSSNS